ncbi:unnamed protein product [Boreogadus saida]
MQGTGLNYCWTSRNTVFMSALAQRAAERGWLVTAGDVQQQKTQATNNWSLNLADPCLPAFSLQADNSMRRPRGLPGGMEGVDCGFYIALWGPGGAILDPSLLSL